MVEGTNRIFTYRDASKSYHLQRTENVKTGVVLHMFCKPGDVVETKCQKDGTFSKPFNRCDKPLTTSLRTSLDKKCPGKIYSVGYAIGGDYLELFRSCYDVATARAVYAESDVFHKTFCKMCFQCQTNSKLSRVFLSFLQMPAVLRFHLYRIIWIQRELPI